MERPTYKQYLKEHWKDTLILLFAHAFIIPSIILLLMGKQSLWDNIIDGGKKYTEHYHFKSLYEYNEETGKFEPLMTSTPNPYHEFLNMTLVVGSLVIWILSILIWVLI